MLLESARLYIGYPGTLTFTVSNAATKAVVSSTTLNVTATRSTAVLGTSANDPLDQGQIYQLNLAFPTAGTYTITVTYGGGATIFRNSDAAAQVIYPISSALNLFSFATNNAITPINFWYYFYETKVKALACSSEVRIPVSLTVPSITQNGTSLVTNLTTGIQWYLNGTIIVGATSSTYTPTQSGKYTVEAESSASCTIRSAEFSFTASTPADETAINLVIYPTPVKADATIAFDVLAKNDVSIKITNILGQVFHTENKTNFIGKYKSELSLVKWPNGTYILNIQIGNESQSRKFIVVH